MDSSPHKVRYSVTLTTHNMMVLGAIKIQSAAMHKKNVSNKVVLNLGEAVRLVLGLYFCTHD